MECGEIKEYLYEYETKRLGEATFNEVDKHLKECKRCQVELEELRKTLTMLQYGKHTELSEDFKGRVMDQINREDRRRTYKKWVLQGTVAASIVLVVVAISRVMFPPQIEKIPRGIEIVIEPSEAENPILVEVEDVNESFDKLAILIKQHNGHIVRKRPIDSRIEVAFNIVGEREGVFLKELSKLGEVERREEGYKDTKGNIVVILSSVN